MANTTPIVTTVMKTTNKEKTPNEADAALKANILNFYEEHYEDILPGTASSSSPVGLRLFDFDFQCPPLLVSLSDARDNKDSLSLPLFMLRERSISHA
nr:hypothetical protein [Tanacetum cinerariifolium]